MKFYPPGDRMAGQNERSLAVVMQYVDGKTNVVWPKQLRTADPVMPLPAGHSSRLEGLLPHCERSPATTQLLPGYAHGNAGVNQ